MLTKLQRIIIRKMADGYTQLEVSENLKRQGISPNSVSTIEKEIKRLKKQFKAKTAIHLFVILIRQGHLK